MKYQILLMLGLSLGLAIGVKAQTAEADIHSVIETLFDGMRAGDSAMVASVFDRSAQMYSIFTNSEGKVVKNEGSLAQFLQAVGTPHAEVWDEKIHSVSIHLDADLASVWTPYSFFVGETFSHCGVNSIQMAKLQEKWKIIYLVDTRRRQNCVD